MLIDEPELGLSPKNQLALANFLQDPEARARDFPHLQNILLATHSHLFLDRREITNNFVVSKTGPHVSLRQITEFGDLHEAQFNLLGNSLEAMFFSSAIVVVEGKTDFAYLQRLVELRFPGRRVAVISSGGDVKRKVHGIREALGDLQKSPYRSRLFAVLDKVHQPGLKAELEKLGVRPTNVITWSRNGIEYLYPPTIMVEVFSCTSDGLAGLEIDDGLVRVAQISVRKSELSEQVLARLDSSTEVPAELERNLLEPLGNAIA